jgi:hypothetical protein
MLLITAAYAGFTLEQRPAIRAVAYAMCERLRTLADQDDRTPVVKTVGHDDTSVALE